jgi:catechol 2,3-dioxygenase-like lactoylglutathione lyase family enzyme
MVSGVRMTEAAIAKAEDIAFVRFFAPDLDKMEQYLADFGLVRAFRSEDRLAMRGADAEPFVHLTERGPAAFGGAGFRVSARGDLDALARASGANVTDSPFPGGGHAVALTDPNGFPIWVVHGQSRPPALPLPPAPLLNDAARRPRIDAPTRMDKGPSTVKRLGHVVLNVKSYPETRAWMQRHLGLIVSDEVQIAGPGSEIGAFMRCDRGDTPTDHHTVFLVGTGTPKFNHAAFEVAHTDDLMRGHYHLKEKGAAHEWGIGRHILGSQIFDYWRDPWGHALEHWTDGDLYTAGSGSRVATLRDLIGTQWGPEAPPTMG